MASTFEALLLAQVNLLLNPPKASLYQITSQSVPNGNFTSLGLDGSAFDTYNGHSTSSNNSRYVAQVPGTYEVTGTVAWPSNATGARGCRIAKNGSPVLGAASFTGTTSGDVYSIDTPAFQVPMVIGDYVEVQGFQSSGGSLSTNVAASDIRVSMNIRLVSL